MGEGLETHAQEWHERGNHDLDSAQLLFDQQGHLDCVAYHIQQAIEKHPKGYLVAHGERPPRVHDLDTLPSRVAQLDPDLWDPYIELCERATRYYLEDRYPPGPPSEYDRDEIRDELDLVKKLMEGLRPPPGD